MPGPGVAVAAGLRSPSVILDPMERPPGDQPRLRVSSDGVHQRRRRVAAVALLALAALVVWAVGSLPGGGGGEEATDGFAARLARIGGTGEGSLLAARVDRESRAVQQALGSTPFVVSGGGNRRMVALTFDDGPSEWTPRIVEILEREGAPATFFTIGGMFETFGGNARAAHSAGFPLANHTWSHPQMPTLSLRDQASQLDRASDSIKQVGAPVPNLYRPPFGAYDAASLKEVNRRGMLMVMWDVDTLDWRQPGADTIVANALAGAKPGSIVLLHDGGGDRSGTVAALPAIIAGLRERGFQLVTVPTLIAEDPPRPGQAPPPVGPA